MEQTRGENRGKFKCFEINKNMPVSPKSVCIYATRYFKRGNARRLGGAGHSSEVDTKNGFPQNFPRFSSSGDAHEEVGVREGTKEGLERTEQGWNV
jgi:hypothetical protein